MRARTLILLLFAVMLAGGTALLARSWLASQKTEITNLPSEKLAPAAKSVLVARADIKRGQILRPEDLIWQVWPEGGIDKNYVLLGGPKKPESFSGWVAKNPIGGGEPITEGRIVAPGNRGFLAAVLRPGMRAISVPVTVTSGISGFIFPGDQVDLMLTYTVPRSTGAGEEGKSNYDHKAAETVLRNIRVIAIDQRLESKAGEAVPAHTATFEVTPKQSEVIALASEIGKVSLALRSLVPSPLDPPASEEAVADASTQNSPDSSVAATATYTLDSEISPLLPKAVSGKDASEGGTVTILRGASKASEFYSIATCAKGVVMRNYLAVVAAASSGLVLTVVVYAAEPMSPAKPDAAAPVAATAPPPATPPPGPPAGPAPAAAEPGRVSQVRTSGPPIVVEAGKGSLIRLPKAAATVFIANPDIADVQVKTPTMIYVSAKAPGETVLYAVDSDDHVLLNAPVRVEHDLSRVRDTLNAIAPGENVTVSSVDNSLVLNGSVSSAGRAEKVRSLAAAIAGETKGTVVNRMAVTTPNQVSIRVKVAEVNRNVIKTLGVNWHKLSGAHIAFDTFNPTTVAGNVPTQLAVAFGGLSWLTATTVDALAQEGLISVLAEPNLTATNGQPASFLAGGEFPVPIAGSAGTAGAPATITVEFKKFGVSLDVTPTIIDPEHLNLKIRSEVSQLSTTGEVSVPITSSATVTIPALTVRRAETTVEMGSGQSYALAGLLQNTDTQNVSKVPALGDIPIIGQLFRSQQFQRNETELVIIVTPYLIQPSPRVANLATPIDGLVPAHDATTIVNGGQYRQTLPAPARGPLRANGQGVVGPVGFRLD